ncbi:MAG: type II toxin-antitoxin system VapC family toxin [Chloroflexaceae bacterium]
MYLWDANILRAFAEGNSMLQQHLARVSWSEIALPSIVVAEVLRGRCEFTLKATPEQAPLAHKRLVETQQLLQQFQVVVFDQKCSEVFVQIRHTLKSRKRYADFMIAAMAQAHHHVVVTRNLSDFADLLPARQLVNWLDTPPA